MVGKTARTRYKMSEPFKGEDGRWWRWSELGNVVKFYPNTNRVKLADGKMYQLEAMGYCVCFVSRSRK